MSIKVPGVKVTCSVLGRLGRREESPKDDIQVSGLGK